VTNRLVKITFAQGTVDEAVQQFEYDAAGNQKVAIDIAIFFKEIQARAIVLTEILSRAIAQSISLNKC
jgi:hypothetical protein